MKDGWPSRRPFRPPRPRVQSPAVSELRPHRFRPPPLAYRAASLTAVDPGQNRASTIRFGSNRPFGPSVPARPRACPRRIHAGARGGPAFAHSLCGRIGSAICQNQHTPVANAQRPSATVLEAGTERRVKGLRPWPERPWCPAVPVASTRGMPGPGIRWDVGRRTQRVPVRARCGA